MSSFRGVGFDIAATVAFAMALTAGLYLTGHLPPKSVADSHLFFAVIFGGTLIFGAAATAIRVGILVRQIRRK